MHARSKIRELTSAEIDEISGGVSAFTQDILIGVAVGALGGAIVGAVAVGAAAIGVAGIVGLSGEGALLIGGLTGGLAAVGGLAGAIYGEGADKGGGGEVFPD